MNKDRGPYHHRTAPEPHIQILKRVGDQTEVWGRGSHHHQYQFAEPSVKRTSLVQEASQANSTSMNLSKDPDTIANMEKGTTFAARARAAELNSARAAAAAKDAMAKGGEDEVPELAPVSLGSLKFTRRTSRKAPRGSRSQDPPVELSKVPTSSDSPHREPLKTFPPPASEHDSEAIVHQPQSSSITPSSSRGGKPKRLASLDAHTSELNQQAIRQKVREVSAKQQAINDNNQDEAYRQGVYASASSSPYSSLGSRVDQTLGKQTAHVNTRFMQENQHQSEAKRETTFSLSQQSRLLSLVDEFGKSRPQMQSLSNVNSRSDENKVIEQSVSETAHRPAEQKISESDASLSSFTPISTETCLNIVELRSPSNNRRPNVIGSETQLPNPQSLIPGQSTSIMSRDSSDQISRNTGVPNRPGYRSTGYTPPRPDYHVPQEVFQSSSSSSAINERSDIDMDMTSRRSTNTYSSQWDASDSREVRGLGSGQLGLENSKASSGIENKSSLGRQSEPGDGQQTQPAYGQTSKWPSYQEMKHQTTSSHSFPQAMDKFMDLEPSPGSLPISKTWDKSNDDPFTDRARSSSTITLASQSYAAPAHLRVKSPAVVTSMQNSSFRPRTTNPNFSRAKTLLPAVKGTGRDQNFKQQPLVPDAWNKGEVRFNPPERIRTDFVQVQKDVRGKHDMSHQLAESQVYSEHSHSPTVVASKTPHTRDPMPYTGFSASASKKDQLLGSLNRTINEAKAKGDLSKSNRSVLFDPVAPGVGSGLLHNASSNTRNPEKKSFSGLSEPRIMNNAIPSEYPDPSLTRPTPDYDPNILKDSEPLPPSVHQQEIETKTPLSPLDGFDLRGIHHAYPIVAPQHPPGLSQATNPFPDAQISNDDGFWDDSFAANSGNPLIEEHMRALGTKTTSWDEEQMHAGPHLNGNAWIEQQKYLLLPTARPTNEQLDELAKVWLVSMEDTMCKSVKDVLLRSEGLAPLPSGTRYWQQSSEAEKLQQAEHSRTASASRLAPIGSERMHTCTSSQAAGAISFQTTNKSYLSTSISQISDTEIRKRAAIDIMAPVLANLASYSAGEDPGPLQRYSQPPAWCIDNTESGRKSFFNDNWGDVPKRVGRDPRYQQTMHEGRSTYFEDPNPSGRGGRDLLPAYKASSGWGMSRK